MLNSSITKNVNNSAVKACIEYMNNSEEYTLEKYLKENNLLEGSKQQGNNTLINCPYHEDSDPSMSVDLTRNIYKCFSCGRGGGYLSFRLDYTQQVLGKEINFYQLLEEILRNDLAMRTVLGFNTIYVKAKNVIKIEKFELFRPRFNEDLEGPRTYIELANRVKRKKASNDDIIMMVSLMQQGIAPTEIYNQIFSTKLKSLVGGVDIDAILGG